MIFAHRRTLYGNFPILLYYIILYYVILCYIILYNYNNLYEWNNKIINNTLFLIHNQLLSLEEKFAYTWYKNRYIHKRT